MCQNLYVDPEIGSLPGWRCWRLSWWKRWPRTQQDKCPPKRSVKNCWRKIPMEGWSWKGKIPKANVKPNSRTWRFFLFWCRHIFHITESLIDKISWDVFKRYPTPGSVTRSSGIDGYALFFFAVVLYEHVKPVHCQHKDFPKLPCDIGMGQYFSGIFYQSVRRLYSVTVSLTSSLLTLTILAFMSIQRALK